MSQQRQARRHIAGKGTPIWPNLETECECKCISSALEFHLKCSYTLEEIALLFPQACRRPNNLSLHIENYRGTLLILESKFVLIGVSHSEELEKWLALLEIIEQHCGGFLIDPELPINPFSKYGGKVTVLTWSFRLQEKFNLHKLATEEHLHYNPSVFPGCVFGLENGNKFQLFLDGTGVWFSRYPADATLLRKIIEIVKKYPYEGFDADFIFIDESEFISVLK